jgi:hypothetical protein
MDTITLIERKSRMPQIQGDQGRSRSKLLRALGNTGDGVSSTFSTGKQNGDFFKNCVLLIEE